MRYIQTPNLEKRATAYIGRNVRTTREEQGLVRDARVNTSTRTITLHCERPDGTYFTTDNEHATIWEDGPSREN